MRPDPTPEELKNHAEKIEAVLTAFGWEIDRTLNDEPDRWNVRRRARDTFGSFVWGSWGWSDHTRKRIEFSLSLPESQRDCHYGIDKPSITVSASKTVEQITNDLKRRFLPGMAAAVQEAVRRNLDQKMARDRRISTLEKSAGLAFDSLSDYNREHFTASPEFYPADYDTIGKIRADVKADSDGLAGLELSNLPPELCASVLDLVRKYAKDHISA